MTEAELRAKLEELRPELELMCATDRLVGDVPGASLARVVLKHMETGIYKNLLYYAQSAINHWERWNAKR